MGVRWVCPSCGSGVIAPERPRRDDLRRYCVDCSLLAERLVERRAPALERRRAEAAARQDARRRAERARERERHVRSVSHAGLNLEELLARLTGLRCLRRVVDLRRYPPELTVRHGGPGSYVSGRAWQPGRIVLTAKRDASAAYAAEVLLHEVVHCGAPRGEHHGRRFRHLLCEAAAEAWGLDPNPDLPAVWDIDASIIRSLEGWTPEQLLAVGPRRRR